ncbi:PREDICTED: putative cysteine-rich receptor-like protein kinase 20 [Nelumbo nucifera]|uniref:Cysteine-rich receptor-like protein kinase 20 n=1 Tax=Nelumbo nucifera TaxID=4432 RepID=A0A1U8Q042_NELNU|nr:PREDICTED: putative cysteine-rich receptor-like protein kinase 20 [Nelumbo nucifera]
MIAIFISVPIFVLVVLGCFYAYYIRGRKERETPTDEQRIEDIPLQQSVGAPTSFDFPEKNIQDGNQMSSSELPLMDFDAIKVATDNFSDSNKLGQGGFGTVYKGKLPNGKEVAVKRLSRKSWQGVEEFKNEIILIAKLQHRNLVKLLDLKPSNVLLDHDMTAKISDFGMARIFCENQNAANTRRVVGTYGYMAPEYAMEGLFSVKSDVFSFGVMLLEIISGKRNNGFYRTEHAQTLLAFARRLWVEGKWLEFADAVMLMDTNTRWKAEVMRCIHIGLLCVQEDAADRPTMSSVILMLTNESVPLPLPTKPAFALATLILQPNHSSSVICSVNMATISDVSPR